MMAKHFPLPRASPTRDLLIVFTTCNLLSMTVLALDYLGHSLDVADLVIVDDHSVDGTVEYLIKKGYFVLTKDTPSGLTDSWNKGYYLAVAMEYKYVIFANNDILVPKGAVRELRRVLMKEALVVPLTTYKGAGHNPSQVQISRNQKR
jgi:glycosyltransferase involved in cell wall biosynthesis